MTKKKWKKMYKSELVDILKKLISFKSITPFDGGAIEYLKSIFLEIGFTHYEENIAGSKCLYVRYGNKGKNLCMSGHVDVVPEGNLSNWISNPFELRNSDGFLYGRGACDMKSSVAVFVSIAKSLVKKKNWRNSLSFLFTSDEERAGETTCGLFLKNLALKGEKIDYCLIGEPTSVDCIGDVVKIGRRGSYTATITINGRTGHVGCPDSFANPFRPLGRVLHELQTHHWDRGTDEFCPTNLEIMDVVSDNKLTPNVVSSEAMIMLNIRFNVLQTFRQIEERIKKICVDCIQAPFSYKIEQTYGNKPFVSSKKGKISGFITSAIKSVTSVNPITSTDGGASDGSYIVDYCEDIVEFGPIGTSAHQPNENISLDDLCTLREIYYNFAKKVLF